MEADRPGWDAGELPIDGDWAADILPAVVGPEAASSIIIIAWRRLVPAVGTVGVSGKEMGGLMGVTVSGAKLKTGVEGIAGKLGYEAEDSPFSAALALLRCVGRSVFTGRRGGDGLAGSGRWFEVVNAGELGVGREAEDSN